MMAKRLTRGQPARHYVDADGRYLGAFASALRPVRVQVGDEPIIEQRRKTRRVIERQTVRFKGEDGALYQEERDVSVERPVTILEPVLVAGSRRTATDEKGLPVTVRVPVMEDVEVGRRPVYEVQDETIAPDLPDGAVEVPEAPPTADHIWNGEAWTLPK